MKRKVAVFTGTRAEYGILYWLLKDIQASEALELQLIVGAMHLSPTFGDTWKQIEADGFVMSAKVEMLLSSDSPVGTAKSMGLGTIGFADALDRLQPDVAVVLGDRFEALAFVQTAMVMGIPVAHLHGGEITEGAYDDAIRHSITKMSYLHFTASGAYRQRVIQMGEAPERVFDTGALGLDHLLRSPRMSHAALAESLGFALKAPYFLVTYHPVTLAEEPGDAAFHALAVALDQFPQHQVIVTYPNADHGGLELIRRLQAYAAANPTRVLAVPSLGFARYLSAMSGAAAVIGNSSSGIIEAPAFGVPTVDIGARQTGRLRAPSIVHAAPESDAIADAIRTVIDPAFVRAIDPADNPYGQGDAARQIVNVLTNATLSGTKHFYDIGAAQ
ncbi:UDP-N-acetylglucosamine 2-epimerase [Pandoraea sp. CB10b_02]|uniref:UDP-N-acetylglucosamine 2-epimerase n=1 Tax=Pandoraea sp. CB10b_02 TaxID=2014535 RepID=UPI00258079F6|nr:UDP-N-acetylglucosamine 2-epimerase [Pandoraea sp. CB10b_02]